MFRPRHTFESVAGTLAEGLSNGTLQLDLTGNRENLRSTVDFRPPTYRRWRIIGIVASCCFAAAICGATVKIVGLARDNNRLAREFARMNATLSKVTAAVSERQTREAQLEAELKASKEQSEEYRRALNAENAKLSIQTSTYSNARPSLDILTTLADVNQQKGDFAAAKAELERALAIARESGSRREEAETLERLSKVYASIGDVTGEENTLVESQHLFLALNLKSEAARTLTQLGTLYKETGRAIQADAAFGGATKLLAESSNPSDGVRVINRTGSTITLTWSGSGSGGQEVVSGGDLKLAPGTYRITVKTRCGSTEKTLQAAVGATEEVTFQCAASRVF